MPEVEVKRIQRDIYKGFYNDKDIDRLFETIMIQGIVIKELLDLFQPEELRRVSTADSIPNSKLAHFRELASLEEPPTCSP